MSNQGLTATSEGTDDAASLRAKSQPVGVMDRIHQVLHQRSTLSPFLVLLLSVVVFSFWAENFLKPSTFSLIIQQVMVVGILGVAQTLVVLTAGIDLSVGSIMVFSSIVMAKLSADSGLPGLLALFLGLLFGAACGFLNGLLVTRAKLPPFIVTLGTLNIFFALNLYVSESATVRGEDMSDVLLWAGRTFSVFGTNFTYGSVILLVLYAVMSYVLGNTAWGRHIYAVGNDPEAARLAGIRSNSVLISVYTVAGLICALGAWMLIGRIASASPQEGEGLNLDSITAVVVGGVSLFGGRGKLLGVLFGALIVGVFDTGLALAGVDVLWRVFAIGVLIIAAVMLDRWIRKVQS